MNFTGKVAIVTGSGRGIGRTIAEHFLQAGGSVVLAEINPVDGEAAAAALTPGNAVLFHRTDVADETSVRALVAATLSRFGRLDCLVNNAAIAAGGPVTELALQDWQRVLGVNLTGPMLGAKYAAQHLAQTRGAIVNIASTRALMSEPNSEAYAASKGGLVALTHALALSLGPAVRVNCISPGWIDTRGYGPNGPIVPPPLPAIDHQQHPAGRVGRPEDIARLVLYLCTEEAGFITGQNFVVDGGMTKKMIYA